MRCLTPKKQTLILNQYDDMSEFASFITYSVSLFFSNNYTFLFLAISSFVVLLYKYRNKRLISSFALYSGILCITILLNPVVFYFFEFIASSGEGSYQVFARLWAAFPVWIAMSIMPTVFIQEKGRWFKHLKLASIVLVLVLFGVSVNTESMVIDSDNQYKINKTALNLANAIIEDSNDKNVGVLYIDYSIPNEGQYTYAGDVVNGMMQYTGKINISVVQRNESELQDLFSSDCYDNITSVYDMTNYVFSSWRRQRWNTFDYVIIPEDESMISKMEYSGYSYISCIDGYYIFKATNRWQITAYPNNSEYSNAFYVIEDNIGNCVFIGCGKDADIAKIEDTANIYGNRIDAWIISSIDNSELSLISEIISNNEIQVGEVFLPSFSNNCSLTSEKDYYEFVSMLNNNGIRVNVLYEDDILDLIGLDMKVLSDASLDGSMVFKVGIDNQYFLFYGNTDPQKTIQLLDNKPDDLDCKYIQLSGSSFYSEDFYSIVSPEFVFCDCDCEQTDSWSSIGAIVRYPSPDLYWIIMKHPDSLE